MCGEPPYPQEGHERMILPAPVGWIGTETPDPEPALMRRMDADHVFMMGDNPALPRMPDKPALLDFFNLRFSQFTRRHLLVSAKRALADGMNEKVVLACLLHDISNGCFVRSDHGYWGAQMIAPYVDEEVAFAVQYHQPLRYFADEAAGYAYPESYVRFFGPDYVVPDYIQRDHDYARGHKYYEAARLVTMYDTYFFDTETVADPQEFVDLLGRHFRQPEEGLGFDNSPVAHMWRTMIWPNNFL